MNAVAEELATLMRELADAQCTSINRLFEYAEVRDCGPLDEYLERCVRSVILAIGIGEPPPVALKNALLIAVFAGARLAKANHL